MDNCLDKVICTDCGSLQLYEIHTERCDREWNGIKCTYNKRIAVCCRCGKRVTVPGLDDLNETEFESKCREENDYIQISEIQDIIEKYDVDKRPLSKVLGLGEHTIENYLKGQLPSKRYSDMLRRVLASYTFMKEYYEKNQDKLNKLAVQRIGKKIEYYSYINSSDTTIEAVALYILNSKYEITNMSLQKLLYYIEAFVQVQLNKRIFDNRCEAWIYGPVFPEIYEKYKSFGKSQIIIDKVDMTDMLDGEVRGVIDFVLDHFAIYNGVTLKDLSHAEAPWINAHSGYGEKEHCTERITHEAITDYFMSVNKKYDLSSGDGVRQYIDSLGVI
ncbi:type II toxin-antitoxin system antitoxin SocA domain-containing protein [Butyrivibrio sp. AE2032]|uniref:type II toxin-antitoxin system antitoxin SocA domain-containing protein n=1 Tax=Butyrivibrio sp. AE2032 TaxID=1458463 RepID=UPI00054FA562|nr:type II toxin-antitoxin system antitoxin SocA domain-containing protein [Butyrivibrio sp. AE2032]